MTALPEFDKTDLLFVGEVVSLGPEPSAWSGRAPAYQTVDYKIIAVLKGKAEGAQVQATHTVVKNSPIARADHPGLSPEYFRAGRRFIVGALLRDKRWLVNYFVPWEEQVERAVRQALASQPAKK